MKFLEKMFLMVKSKVKKKQGFNLSLQNKVFKKPQGELNLPPSFLG